MSADNLTVLRAINKLLGDDPDSCVDREQIREAARPLLGRHMSPGGIQPAAAALAPVDEQLRWLEESGLISVVDGDGLAPASPGAAPWTPDDTCICITAAGLAELAAREDQ